MIPPNRTVRRQLVAHLRDPDTMTFLRPQGPGWEVVESSPELPYSNTRVGQFLVNQPWQSGWLLNAVEPWSMRCRVRGKPNGLGAGVPENWALRMLNAAGVGYTVAAWGRTYPAESFYATEAQFNEALRLLFMSDPHGVVSSRWHVDRRARLLLHLKLCKWKRVRRGTTTLTYRKDYVFSMEA